MLRTAGRIVRGGRWIAEGVRGQASWRRSRRQGGKGAGEEYMVRARAEGKVSRAAFKFGEIDDRERVLAGAPNNRVLELGAAPGSWTIEVAQRLAGGRWGGGAVTTVDPSRLDARVEAALAQLRPGVEHVHVQSLVEEWGGAAADGYGVVLSDMAPAATGARAVDVARAELLFDAALAVVDAHLCPGGLLVYKAFRNGSEATMADHARARFRRVKWVKPKASRRDSKEIFLVARDFHPPS